MSVEAGRESRVRSILGVVLLACGCAVATRRMHSFSEMVVAVTPAIQVSVNAYGTWSTLPDTDSVVHVSGSPYVLEIRVRGAGDAVMITAFRISEAGTDSSVSVTRWGSPAFDPSDSSMVFGNRTGVSLSPSSKEITGKIRIEPGTSGGALELSFTGLLEYQYREDTRNSFLERLRGI